MGDSFLMAMPWKTRNLEEQRWELVRLMRGGKVSVCELCRRLLISRKTAYKWRRRHRLEGVAGLRGRPHTAQVVHGRPSQVWLERIRQWRRRHPHWGPRQ